MLILWLVNIYFEVESTLQFGPLARNFLNLEFSNMVVIWIKKTKIRILPRQLIWTLQFF